MRDVQEAGFRLKKCIIKIIIIYMEYICDAGSRSRCSLGLGRVHMTWSE